MKLFNTFVFVLSVLVFSTAFAHEEVRNYNQITLEAVASADVENDTMIASLYAQEEGSRAAELSDRVNKRINHALAKIKNHEAIKVETESYSTTPVYSKNQVVAWRVRQSIQLESKDMPLMSELLGELQQQLKLNGISFDVSREKREKQTRALIDQALTAYNNRATQITKKLQRDGYKIVSMNVSTSESEPPQRYRMSRLMVSEAASVTAPQMAGGDQVLSVRVNGTIELE